MFTPKYFYGRCWTPKFWAPAGAYDDARFVQIADLDTPQALAMPRNVNYVMIQAQDADVRYRDDGIVPTAAIGLILYAGDPPTKFAGSIKLLRFIQVTATAKLNIRYY